MLRSNGEATMGSKGGALFYTIETAFVAVVRRVCQ
jgi:hypothetical protein